MPDTPTTERLHDELERQLNDPTHTHAVAGRSVRLDPGLLQTMDTLRAMDACATPAPDAAFAARLREDLMHTLPLPALPDAAPRPTDRPGTEPHSRRFLPGLPGWARSGAGAFSTLVTIGLVIALVIATLGWWDRRADPIPPTPSQVAFNAATATPSQTIPLTMSDSGFEPAVLDIAPGTASPVTLRIANIGTHDRRFVIPVLGVSIDVPVAETRDVSLILRDGAYAFFSANSGDIADGLFGQLTVPVGTGDRTAPPLPNLVSTAAPVWSNTTVTLKARPVRDGRPLVTFPAGMSFQPVPIDGEWYGNIASAQTTVGGMNWTLVLAETGALGWIETGHLTQIDPIGSTLAQATASASPVAAMDSPPIMTAGGPGRSWSLGETNPRTDGAPRQITADMSFSVTSALVVGDSIIVSGYDTTSQYGMGSIRRIDLRTGKTLWSVDAKPWGELAAQGNLLYSFTRDPKRVTDYKPRVSAFSLSTGEEVWASAPLVAGSDAVSGYGPILMDGMLYASDAAGNTVALDPSTGEQHWQYPETFVTESATEHPASSMIGVDGAIIIAMADQRLVRLDAATGTAQKETAADAFGANVLSVTLSHESGDVFFARVTVSPEPRSVTWSVKTITIQDLTITLSTEEGIRFSLNDIADADGGVLMIAQGPSGPALQRIVSDTPPDAIDADNRPRYSWISMAGDTVMQLGANGELTFIPLSDGRAMRNDLPIRTQETTGAIPPLMWGETPVVISKDGAIWTLDSDASPLETGTTLTFTDEGFTQNEFTAQGDQDGHVRLTLRNDGTEPRTIVIPSLGVDTTIPAGTSLHVDTFAVTTVYAIFARNGGFVESKPGFVATLQVSGSYARPRSDAVSVAGVMPTDTDMIAAEGASLYSRPDLRSPIIAQMNRASAVTLLVPGDKPQPGALYEDASGGYWSLVRLHDYGIGWMPLGLLQPGATPATSQLATPNQSANTDAVTLTITVDPMPLVGQESEAVAATDTELQRVLAPYVDAGTCQIGFVLITSGGRDFSTATYTSDKVAARLYAVAPTLLPKDQTGNGILAYESIPNVSNMRTGEVHLQIFWNAGCTVTPAS